MVFQKHVRKEAGLTARRGTLHWGVEHYRGVRNLIMGRGTLPWGVEHYHWVRNLMGRGTLP